MNGTGLVLPIAKAYGHLLAAFLIVRNEWDAEVQNTRYEISDAIEHLNGLQWPPGALTQETILQIEQWRTEMSEIQRWMTVNVGTSYPDDAVQQLRNAITASQNILNRLDIELTGTEAAVAGDVP